MDQSDSTAQVLDALSAISLLLSILCLVVAIAVGLILARKWKNANPAKLGFKWGTVFSLHSLIWLLLVCLVFLIGGVFLGLFFWVAIGCGFFGFLGYAALMALRRRKWALVVTTIASLNPLIMLINLFYLRNRWAELGEEEAARQAMRDVSIV